MPGSTFVDSVMVGTGVPRLFGVHLPPSYRFNSSSDGSSSGCVEAAAAVCEGARRASAGNCFMCTGEHQPQLAAAGCTEADLTSFCQTGRTAPLPPLLISMHGWGGRISSHEALTGLSALADREGFIVVYPQGMGDANQSSGCVLSPFRPPRSAVRRAVCPCDGGRDCRLLVPATGIGSPGMGWAPMARPPPWGPPATRSTQRCRATRAVPPSPRSCATLAATRTVGAAGPAAPTTCCSSKRCWTSCSVHFALTSRAST
jgi:hypothetical protein